MKYVQIIMYYKYSCILHTINKDFFTMVLHVKPLSKMYSTCKLIHFFHHRLNTANWNTV